MAHKSKTKGNKFENQIYKELRDLIPDIKKTIGSGNSENDADLVSNNFVIELKHYHRIAQKKLNEWWSKVSKEADRYRKKPILIFKEDYKKPKVMLYAHIGTITLPVTIEYLAFKQILISQVLEEDIIY